MRNADDLETAEAWPDTEPPPRPCPECGDDDRHQADCSRNPRRYPSHREPYDPRLDWPERYTNGGPI